MNKKSFSYNLRSAQDGQKKVGGTLRADSFEDAASKLNSRLELCLMSSGRVSFVHGGVPVFAYLSVEPEGPKVAKLLEKAAERREKAAAEEAAAKKEVDRWASLIGYRAVLDRIQTE